MYKFLTYFVVFLTPIYIESSGARTVTGAAVCPETMSIDVMRSFLKKQENSKVDWAGTEWTLVRRGGTVPPKGIEKYTIQKENPLNDSGLLFCSYRIKAPNPRINSMVTLSAEYTGPI